MTSGADLRRSARRPGRLARALGSAAWSRSPRPASPASSSSPPPARSSASPSAACKGVPARRGEDARRPARRDRTHRAGRLTVHRRTEHDKHTLQQSHRTRLHAHLRGTAPPAARTRCRTTTWSARSTPADEWIRQRTGIITRMRAGAETTAIDLATDAARRRSRSRASTRADRRRHRRDHLQRAADAVDAAIVADRVGANPAAAYDIERRLRGLRLRRGPGGRADPHRRRALRAGRRRREALATSSTRRTAGSRSSSATAPARS